MFLRIGCLIQARTGSKRLPNKINADIGGRPLIWHVHERVKASAVESWVITPNDFPEADENDVLSRYWLAAKKYELDGVIRVTGDCPLMDPAAVSRVHAAFQTLLYDYVANDIYLTYPDGIGVECFSYPALEYAHHNARGHGREHVTTFLKSDKTISKLNLRCPINGISDLKLSVDTQKDLDFVRAIDAAGPRDYSLAATLEAIGRVQNQD